jgi:hypothetical protein
LQFLKRGSAIALGISQKRTLMANSFDLNQQLYYQTTKKSQSVVIRKSVVITKEINRELQTPIKEQKKSQTIKNGIISIE